MLSHVYGGKSEQVATGQTQVIPGFFPLRVFAYQNLNVQKHILFWSSNLGNMV